MRNAPVQRGVELDVVSLKTGFVWGLRFLGPKCWQSHRFLPKGSKYLTIRYFPKFCTTVPITQIPSTLYEVHGPLGQGQGSREVELRKN